LHAISGYFLHLIDHFGYIGLFVAMTLGNIGAPIGSEVLLPAAGALTATHHLSNLALTVAVAVVAELCGQSIAYAIGRFGGRPFLDRYGKFVRFHHAEMAKVEAFFERYGSFAIFICRFVPVIRGVVGIPAGISEMPLAPFYLWTFLGSLAFCGALILLGNSLGTHLGEVTAALHKSSLVIAVAVIVAIILGIVLSQRRAKKQVA
jgi:membrane protein DedA with SNARE-associated domain